MNCSRTLCGALAAAAVLAATASSSFAQEIRKVFDPARQMAEMKPRGDPMGFRAPSSLILAEAGSHWQGIVRHPDPEKPYFYAVSSRPGCTELHVIRIGSSDSKSSYRMRSNRLSPTAQAISTEVPEGDRIVNAIPLPDQHAGGMQAAGKYLAIPMCYYDDCVTDPALQVDKIGIYDISDAANPVLAQMFFDQNSIPGGMAELSLAQLDDGSFFMVGAGGEGGQELHQFKMAADLSGFDDTSNPRVPDAIWPSGQAFQSYQLLNPVGEIQTDGSEIMYLLGLRNTSGAGVLQDEAWLYRLRITNREFEADDIELISVTDLSSRTSPESPQMNGNWAAGGSAWVSPTGTLMLYSCEHDVTGLNYSVTLSEFSNRLGDAFMATDACTAQVFLYTDTNFGGKVLSVDALDFNRKNFANLFLFHEGAEGFWNNVSSVTWRLPPGGTARIYNGVNGTGDYLELSGGGEIADLSNVSWTTGGGNVNDRIESVQFSSAATPAFVRYLGPLPAGDLNGHIDSRPCAMLKLSEGDYPGPATIGSRVELRAINGLVRLGTQ